MCNRVEPRLHELAPEASGSKELELTQLYSGVANWRCVQSWAVALWLRELAPLGQREPGRGFHAT